MDWMVLILIFGYLCSVSSDSIAEGTCIWRGVCGTNPDIPDPGIFGANNLNCAYDGPSSKLGEVATAKLTEACPEMVADIKNEFGALMTCCNNENIDDLASQLTTLSAIVSRCPACQANLKRDFCYFTCHPYQSTFLVPTRTYEAEEGTSVWEVDFYANPEYTEGAYSSCENVYYAALSSPALDLLCGGWGTEYCSAERLFNYFGNNDLAPFVINYHYTDKEQEVTDVYDNVHHIVPANFDVIPCNTSDEAYGCSCTDCVEACPVVEAEPEEEPNMVGDLRLYVFVILMCFVVFTVAVIFLVLFPYRWILYSSATTEKFLRRYFYLHGKFVAKHPYIILAGGLIVVIILCCGISKVEITNDPVELWAGPESDSRIQKEYFDEKFGPFYRTTQVIFTADSTPSFTTPIEFEDDVVNMTFGGIYDTDIMDIGFDLQQSIMNLEAEYDGEIITLNKICNKPLSPQNDDCLIESIYNYFQNNYTYMASQYENNEYLETLITCINNPTYTEATKGFTCLGTYGGVIFPYVALGGFLQEGQTLNDNPSYTNASAIVITILNDNYQSDDEIGPALAWEEKFIEFMNSYSNPKISVAYYTERSIEDSIKELGESDVWTVVLSYLIMFAYISLSLGGSFSCGDSAWVNMKISLGLGGVVLVLLSVLSASGLSGYVELQSTVFVLEVVPFITLAVGVDNIFLLVQTWQRIQREPEESIENHIGRVVGAVGPSMILATVSEVICFFLGALSDMPAVYTFSINAGIALVVDFLLQITCFVAFLTLDAKRVEANRYDVAFCKKASKKVEKAQTNIFENFFEKYYGPVLMMDLVRAAVLILFAGTACTSASYIPKLGIGLDQNIAMPDESYVLKYFEYLEKYLSVGSPVYFVMTEGYDYAEYSQQNLVCSQYDCDDNSMLSQIFFASLTPEITTIATGASSWLEPYFTYMSDHSTSISQSQIDEACCRLDENGTFIDSSEPIAEEAATTCLGRKDIEEGRPKPEYFMEFLPYYLIDNPHGLYCSQAGHAAYADAVRILGEENDTYVGANSFMAYHSILSTSVEFTEAVRQAYILTDSITEYLQTYSNTTDIEVFPYSIFYVYYEQYLEMWDNAKSTLLISLGSLFIVMFLATGFDVLSAFINLIIIFLIIVHVMGCMYAWNIELNAISLVNLVMVSGISVEFCAHFTRAFNLRQHGNRKSRVISTLATTGASILSGIAITKLAGIIVLGFANSQVFVIYYFRMYLLMVIFSVCHGLILLPVILSFVGNPINPYLSRDKKLEKPNGDVKLTVVEENEKLSNGNHRTGIQNNGFINGHADFIEG